MARDYIDLDLAEFIDHTLLSSVATPDYIAKGCEEGDRFQFPAVCVFPTHVDQAVELLHQSKTQVCTVIGFPCGANTLATKLYEAQDAVERGATELDVVINLSWLKSGKTEEVHREIAEICEETGVLVKAILETGLLTDAEKKLAAEICMDAGVRFLKTSTGWFGGATVEDVRLLKSVAKDQVGIKASGGIRTVEQATELILAGATRLGTSRGVELVLQQRNPADEADEDSQG